MSDLDITIRLDPAQPVSGAKAITAEVTKLEAKANDAKRAADGISQLNFKQAASAAAQGFELLNARLKITNSEMGKLVQSTVKFGALGAQIGGPWGAVIGVVVGGLVELVDALDNGENQTESMVFSYRRFHDVTINYAVPATKTLREAITDIGKEMSTFHASLEAISNVNIELTMLKVADAFQNASGAIGTAARQLALFDRLSGSSRLKLAADVAAIWPMLDDEGRANALKLIEGMNDAAVKAAKAHQDLIVTLTGPALHAKLTLGARGMVADTISGGAVDTSFEQQTNTFRDMGSFGPLAGTSMSVRIREAQESLRVFNEEFAKGIEAGRRMEQVVGSIGDIVRDQILSSATQLTSTLVDAANGANVSWSQTFQSILVGFQKAITQALVLKALTGSVTGAAGADGKAVGGLFGALGFASGGMIYPSGSGTGDTMPVMFRKAPSETVRIHTPAQEAAYRRGGPEGGGGSQTVRVVSDVDRRRLYNDRDLIVDIGRNRDVIRRLIA